MTGSLRFPITVIIDLGVCRPSDMLREIMAAGFDVGAKSSLLEAEVCHNFPSKKPEDKEPGLSISEKMIHIKSLTFPVRVDLVYFKLKARMEGKRIGFLRVKITIEGKAPSKGVRVVSTDLSRHCYDKLKNILSNAVVSVSTISAQVFGMVKGSCLDEVGVCVLEGRIGRFILGAKARNLFDWISLLNDISTVRKYSCCSFRNKGFRSLITGVLENGRSVSGPYLSEVILSNFVM
ncbi:hypothetical protein ACH5RR_013359 [Cinchona calisaya]|uniref:Uncharacterized protein n=1 Tax=Cinchona calisaya TaxID=153742 RepID=A0ABD3A3G0_9GENT